VTVSVADGTAAMTVSAARLTTMKEIKLLTDTIGTCVACKRGLNQMCDAKAVNGITKDGGCKQSFPSLSPEWS